MSQSQMDELARILEQSGNEKEVRSAVYQTGDISRRKALVMGCVGLAVIAGGGGAVALGMQVLREPTDLQASAQPGQHEGTHSPSPGTVNEQNVIWRGHSQKGARPVLAPRGTGAVIDSNGHVQIVASDGTVTTSSDVTPQAALVAGTLSGKDVIAWTTGRVMSWWTAQDGIQRVEHTRPLGITAVAGGVLVFDNGDWSGRLDQRQVTQIAAGNDSITIGVMEDGTALAATADGVVTKWAKNGDMQVLQPTAPRENVQVRRAVGIYQGHLVLVWDDPAAQDENRQVPFSVMSLDDGATKAIATVPLEAAVNAKMKRSRHGAEFAGKLIATDGTVEDTPEEFTVVDTAGDYLLVKDEDNTRWLDVKTGQATSSDEQVTYQLTSSRTQWIVRETECVLVQMEGQR